MLVMHEPMNTSSIGVPATSDSGCASSGSFGQASSGSVISLMSILDDLGVLRVRVGAACSTGSASQASMACARRSSVRRILVALGDHPAQHHDVRLQVLGDGLL